MPKQPYGAGEGFLIHFVFADSIASKLDDDPLLFSHRARIPAELHRVDDRLLQACLPRGWFVGCPDVFSVHLSRRDKNRQLDEARFETGLAPEVVVHGCHALSHRRTVESQCRRSEPVRDAARVVQFLPALVQRVAPDRRAAVARFGMEIGGTHPPRCLLCSGLGTDLSGRGRRISSGDDDSKDQQTCQTWTTWWHFSLLTG